MTSARFRQSPGTGYDGQTYLVGERVYIRTFERGDGANGQSWRDSIFPKSPELMETWIEEDLPKAGKDRTGFMAVVRKRDDLIIGSVLLKHQDVNVYVGVHVDPLQPDAAAMKAEAYTLVLDWIVNECQRPVAHTSLPASETAVIEALAAFGARESARWREYYLRDGERVDRVWLEYLNAAWVANLGDPNDIPIERTGSGAPRPVPPKAMLDGDPPKNAVMVGTRVYLRPETSDDAKLTAKYAYQETETFFDIGRHILSSVNLAGWMMDFQKKDHPDWAWFSVCLRENDEFIGSVGLIDIDLVNLKAETGSMFHRKAYRGSGYGSEAKQLLLEYAFDVLGLHMVESWVYFENTRSAAALRKQGYREAGQINWLYPQNGRFNNMVTFDLLASEWRAMPRETTNQ